MGLMKSILAFLQAIARIFQSGKATPTVETKAPEPPQSTTGIPKDAYDIPIGLAKIQGIFQNTGPDAKPYTDLYPGRQQDVYVRTQGMVPGGVIFGLSIDGEVADVIKNTDYSLVEIQEGIITNIRLQWPGYTKYSRPGVRFVRVLQGYSALRDDPEAWHNSEGDHVIWKDHSDIFEVRVADD